MRLTTYLIALGLLLPGCSQMVAVPTSPDGHATVVDITAGKGTAQFDMPGYIFYTAPILSVVYRAEEGEIEHYFGPALDAMNDILTAGLDELPRSYAALLSTPHKPLGNLSWAFRGDTPIALDQADQILYLDRHDEQPQVADKERLQRDFGDALATLAQTMKTMRSYIILLESPDGAAGKVVYRAHDSEVLLEQTGRSLTLDGLEHLADEDTTEKDFSPVKASTEHILNEGLPKLAHSYAALMENPAGPLGEIAILEGKAQGVLLNEANQAVIIDGYSDRIYLLDEAQYRKDFDETLDAMPLPPVTHYLYFASGSANLIRDSQAVMPAIIETIRNRPAVDVSINGHADTVGDDRINDRLSLKRGEAVAALIRKSGVRIQEIGLNHYGKTQLAVDTQDNTSELLNRRVEITIR